MIPLFSRLIWTVLGIVACGPLLAQTQSSHFKIVSEQVVGDIQEPINSRPGARRFQELHYKCSVTYTGPGLIKNGRIEYIALTNSQRLKLQDSFGRDQVFAPGETIELKTTPYKSFIPNEGESSGFVQNKLVGFWVRVYGDGVLLSEHCNPSSLATTMDWPGVSTNRPSGRSSGSLPQASKSNVERTSQNKLPDIAESDLTKPRTFTDRNGQTVNGVITAIDSGSVIVITQENGSKVKAKLDSLVEADGQFAQVWYVKKVLSRGRTLQFQAKRGKEDAKDNFRVNGNMAMAGTPGTSAEDAYFDVSVRNPGPLPIEMLTIEYILFAEHAMGGNRTYKFSSPMGLIASGESKQLSTERVRLNRTPSVGTNVLDSEGYIVDKNYSKPTRDTLKGIWVKAFVGDIQVGEFSDPAAIMQNNAWGK